MRRTLLALLLPLLAAPDASALRVMTYNILNYSGGRTDELRTVLEETQPDVLVVQEILSQSAVNGFRTNVLEFVNPGEWVAGPFVNGSDTDNAIFYRAAACTLVGHHIISTALRDIDEWTIRPNTHETAGADLRLYVLHLKASQGGTNEQKRLAEVQAMRARMETFPAGQSYSVLGDFNIYRATEPAYLYMTAPGNGPAGVVQDPISREGNWHINPDFADIHTQSPRVTQFGGGATGGMDDRFDMMLVSPADQDGEGWDILEPTYTAFGQDGQHFDGALNVAPFTVVTQAVAQALHDASDHLPVYADWQTPARLTTVASLDLGTIIVGGSASAQLPVDNDVPLPADELDYSFTAPPGFTAPAGAFQIEAGEGPELHSIGLDGGAVGFAAGDLVVTTDDPDAPAAAVALSGAVLDHAQPSTEAGSVQLLAAVDFGTADAGTTLAAVQAHDFGWGPLRAELEVYDAALTGDPRFSLPSFAPVLAGATPASVEVAFDATGAPDGTYLATLTLSTRDRPDLSGAQNRADLVYDLEITVGGAVDAPVVASGPAPGLGAVTPNPFRGGTTVRYAVGRPGPVELRIYDVRGRLVRGLVGTARPAGEHSVEWDGRDEAGRTLAPGIYFLRFVGDGVAETRKLVRVR